MPHSLEVLDTDDSSQDTQEDRLRGTILLSVGFVIIVLVAAYTLPSTFSIVNQGFLPSADSTKLRRAYEVPYNELRWTLVTITLLVPFVLTASLAFAFHKFILPLLVQRLDKQEQRAASEMIMMIVIVALVCATLGLLHGFAPDISSLVSQCFGFSPRDTQPDPFNSPANDPGVFRGGVRSDDCVTC